MLEFNVLFKGCHVSSGQARFGPTCKTAEPKCSTAFNKDQEALVQEQGVSVWIAMRIPKSKLLCDLFPCISTTFCVFPPLATNFRDLPYPSLEQLTNRLVSAQFPQISATFHKVWKCSVHCMGVVALRSGAHGAQLQRGAWKVWLFVFLTSRQREVFHTDKVDYQWSVKRKCSAWA